MGSGPVAADLREARFGLVNAQNTVSFVDGNSIKLTGTGFDAEFLWRSAIMIRSLGRVTFLFVCSTFFTAASAQDSIGSSFVTGHVYDSSGKPLANATVDLFPLERSTSGPIPWAVTDKDGAYRLITPAFGKTRICAK